MTLSEYEKFLQNHHQWWNGWHLNCFKLLNFCHVWTCIHIPNNDVHLNSLDCERLVNVKLTFLRSSFWDVCLWFPFCVHMTSPWRTKMQHVQMGYDCWLRVLQDEIHWDNTQLNWQLLIVRAHSPSANVHQLQIAPSKLSTKKYYTNVVTECCKVMQKTTTWFDCKWKLQSSASL